jgi:hypothetical protein
VAVAAMSFGRFRLRGEERTLAVSVAAATHPDFRGRGLFGDLELEHERRAAERGADGVLAYHPSPRSWPLFVGKLGFHQLWSGRLWARVLSASGVAAYALRRPRPAGGLPSPGLDPEPAGGDRIERIESFVPEIAELAGSTPGNAAVRDPAYLTWRYGASPRDYRCFGVFAGEAPVAVAALGYAARRGVAAATILDVLASPGSSSAATDVLRRCVREARTGADAVIALPPRGLHGSFLRAGFLPMHQSLRVAGKDLRAGALRGDWTFTLGDFDFL